jgi:predicted transcriptional regulator
MNTEIFIDIPIVSLSSIVAIDRGNLCKIFRGKAMNEATINKAAKALEIEPHEFLRLVNARRDYKKVVLSHT